MRKELYRVLFVSLIMILSSLAGCIGDTEEDAKDDSESNNDADAGNQTVVLDFGKIMVSTYHVGELVSAIVGDTADVQLMSTSNIPVHDYEPSLQDIVRLQNSDAFFYHGLGLEPWVESTLSNLGSDAPPSYAVHTMPSGEITLDYESLLVSSLCEELTSGDVTTNTLQSYNSEASNLEIHLEKGVQSLTFPAADDSHDGHDHGDHDDHDHDDEDGHDEDGHDDGDHSDHGDEDGHDEDGHDEDGHDEDGHDDGDHSDHGDEDGHDEDGHDDGDHSDHGDEDGHDEHGHDEHGHGEEGGTPEKVIENPAACPANTVISVYHLEEGEHIVEFSTNWWARTTFDMTAQQMLGGHAHHHHDHGDDHDDHGDEDGHDEDGHDEDGHDEDGHDEDGHDEDGHDDDDAPTPEDLMSMTDSDSSGTMTFAEFMAFMNSDSDNSGESTPDFITENFSLIFDNHDADTSGDLDMNELPNFITEVDAYMDSMEDDDDGHHDDDDDHHDGVCHNLDTHENVDYATEEDCEAAGHMWMEDHDDHGDEPVCHNSATHENTDHATEEECEAAGHIWMEGHDDHEEPNNGTRGYLTIHVENEGDYGFAVPSDISIKIMMSHAGHDGHGGHGDHGDHDDHDDHGDEDGHDDGDHSGDSDDDMVCYDTSTHTVDTSYTNQADCEAAGLMWTAANSGPGGDGAHDDDDHDDEESEVAADEDEEAFEYDPHSWLDPIAFKAQTQLVLDALIEQFPAGNETFTANAAAFMLELDKIHLGYTAAFGADNTCTTMTAAANHNAYSYITVRYGVEFVTVHGLDPEGEPTTADIAEVIEKINEDQINVLYIEEYTEASAVNSIVEDTGVQVLYLYTMEMSPTDSSDNYLTMMNKNLDNLKTGLGCTV
jgi:ABC-type Zn uptake system ZnuABC Zn-binding protein ZnuA